MFEIQLRANSLRVFTIYHSHVIRSSTSPLWPHQNTNTHTVSLRHYCRTQPNHMPFAGMACNEPATLPQMCKQIFGTHTPARIQTNTYMPNNKKKHDTAACRFGFNFNKQVLRPILEVHRQTFAHVRCYAYPARPRGNSGPIARARARCMHNTKNRVARDFCCDCSTAGASARVRACVRVGVFAR